MADPNGPGVDLAVRGAEPRGPGSTLQKWKITVTPGSLGKLVIGGASVVAMLIFVSCSITTVDKGHRGIKVRFGKVLGEGLPEGLYFVNP